MTPSDLKACGNLLYGERWQSALSHALGLTDTRTMRYWSSGERKVPAGARQDIIDLAAAKLAENVAIAMGQAAEKMGEPPQELTLHVYPSGYDMTTLPHPGEWSADFHRKVVERVAELLRECGIVVRLREAVAVLSR